MKILKYLLRFVGVVMISCAVSWGLYKLATWVYIAIMTLVPLFLKSIFDFSWNNVTDAFFVSRITGINIRWAAAITSNDFPVRITLILNTIGVFIAFALLVYVTSWLVRIIKGSKLLTIVSSLPLLFTILNLYISFYCNPFIIDKGFWFYCLTIIIILFILAYIGITIHESWTYEE